MALYFGDVLDRKAIDVKPIMIEEVVGHDCLDSITSTSTVSLSTSTMLLLHARTTGITEHEELTQRRSKRTTECFAASSLESLEVRTMFVFSVCRLVSWRCHNISAMLD
jgi:hypothetical protein